MSTADQRQAQHALAALAHTSPGRRRLIAACAEEYLSQVDRRRLPLGWGQPITDDHFNRADAYEMRRGNVFARMLGISCRPSDPQLPDTARAVLAAIDAPVRKLTATAVATGQPRLVAALYIAGLVVTPVVATANPTRTWAILDDTIETIDREDDKDDYEQEPEQLVARQMLAVASHFTTHRPADRMTDAARMTVALRSAGSAFAARPVLRALPFPKGRITRGEYGQHVLEVGA
ncbi:hypothetical protein ACFU98_10700 [Streptomyces sp. NPDC057575]|uniref:hypothetical protein n=1 Tax=unclassified Streptomyces TaxID=2593676 RepID=UPI0036ACD8D7